MTAAVGLISALALGVYGAKVGRSLALHACVRVTFTPVSQCGPQVSTGVVGRYIEVRAPGGTVCLMFCIR